MIGGADLGVSREATFPPPRPAEASDPPGPRSTSTTPAGAHLSPLALHGSTCYLGQRTQSVGGEQDFRVRHRLLEVVPQARGQMEVLGITPSSVG